MPIRQETYKPKKNGFLAEEIKPQKNYRLEHRIKGSLNEPPEPGERYLCNQGYLIGTTSEENRYFFKSLHCGKEYCSHCGRDYSIPHERRYVKLWDNVLSCDTLGYLVVTIPAHLREYFKDKTLLNKFKTFWKRKLKRSESYKTNICHHQPIKKRGRIRKNPLITYKERERPGYEFGYIRWHWAGDDCSTWKPHLNILFPGGYLHPELLDKWRADLATWFIKELKLKKDDKLIPNLFYQYIKRGTDAKSNNIFAAKVIHWIKYITRATLKNPEANFKIEFQKFSFNYKNGTKWGKWPKGATNESRESAILRSCDPETGEIITWSMFTRTLAAIKVETVEQLELGITIYTGQLIQKLVKPLGQRNPKNLKPVEV